MPIIQGSSFFHFFKFHNFKHGMWWQVGAHNTLPSFPLLVMRRDSTLSGSNLSPSPVHGHCFPIQGWVMPKQPTKSLQNSSKTWRKNIQENMFQSLPSIPNTHANKHTKESHNNISKNQAWTTWETWTQWTKEMKCSYLHNMVMVKWTSWEELILPCLQSSKTPL